MVAAIAMLVAWFVGAALIGHMLVRLVLRFVKAPIAASFLVALVRALFYSPTLGLGHTPMPVPTVLLLPYTVQSTVAGYPPPLVLFMPAFLVFSLSLLRSYSTAQRRARNDEKIA